MSSIKITSDQRFTLHQNLFCAVSLLSPIQRILKLLRVESNERKIYHLQKSNALNYNSRHAFHVPIHVLRCVIYTQLCFLFSCYMCVMLMSINNTIEQRHISLSNVIKPQTSHFCCDYRQKRQLPYFMTVISLKYFHNTIQYFICQSVFRSKI